MMSEMTWVRVGLVVLDLKVKIRFNPFSRYIKYEIFVSGANTCIYSRTRFRIIIK